MGEFDSTLGALSIGYVIAWGLFGVMCMQTFSYFQKFPEDSAWLKSLVAVLWVLDTLQLVLLGHGLYFWVITNYANPLALIDTIWSLPAAVLVTATIVVLVQMFLARRLFILSQRNWFLAGIVVLLSCSYYGLGITAEVISFEVQKVSLFFKFKSVTIGGLACSAVADVILALSLCFYLMRSRTGLKTTDSIVKKLVLYAMTTGLLTAVIAIVDIICFLTMPGNLIHLSFNIIAGKLYSNSLLASLNVREEFRNNMDHNTFNLSSVTTGQGVSGFRFQTSGTNREASTVANTSQNYTDKVLGTSRVLNNGHNVSDPQVNSPA